MGLVCDPAVVLLPCCCIRCKERRMSVGSRAGPALHGGGVHHLLSFFQRGRCGPCLKEQRQRSTILMVGSLHFSSPFYFLFSKGAAQ